LAGPPARCPGEAAVPEIVQTRPGVLAAEGVADFSGYAVVADAPLLPDLFL